MNVCEVGLRNGAELAPDRIDGLLEQKIIITADIGESSWEKGFEIGNLSFPVVFI